jgi:predicted outer membrane protein
LEDDKMVTESRRLRWTATIVTGLAGGLLGGLLIAPAAAMAQNAPAEPGAGAGPVTPADRDLLVKVRLAGLWEMPAGQMAAEKGASQRVREIGAEISAQHVELDRLVVAAAARLNVPLPERPNVEQQGWLKEMQGSTGAQFDQIFVDRLRAAHGAVFPAIAVVRTGTRNEVVRVLAQQSNDFVMNHLTLLESTGLVDYGSLPLPQAGAGGPVVPDSDSALFSGANARGVVGAANVNQSVVWIVLAAALIAGAYSLVRLMRAR